MIFDSSLRSNSLNRDMISSIEISIENFRPLVWSIQLKDNLFWTHASERWKFEFSKKFFVFRYVSTFKPNFLHNYRFGFFTDVSFDCLTFVEVDSIEECFTFTLASQSWYSENTKMW